MNKFDKVCEHLKLNPEVWLITGVAGFIGSNILESLLKLNQRVIGLDNFETGNEQNLKEVQLLVGIDQWKKFKFIEGDIRSLDVCKNAVKGVNYVLHQAALGSVPRSIKDPITTNSSNINGFLNILNASKDEKVDSFIYAASSSTYGDHKALPKIEERIGSPLSPYAVTKLVNEHYAKVFSDLYKINCIGLRYFNVFGPRQSPTGPYAAVIPKWINSMLTMEEVTINGDGTTSRDFCYVDNVVQANILAAVSKLKNAHEVFNVALGNRTSLLDLFNIIKESLKVKNIEYEKKPNFVDFRAGDVKHSQADISKIITKLGFIPTHDVTVGIQETISWSTLKNNKND